MKHPKSENTQKIADFFRSLPPESKLDMTDGRSECGCVGSRYYHFAMSEEQRQHIRNSTNFNEKFSCPQSGMFEINRVLLEESANFIIGAQQIAHTLGFKNSNKLKVWADKNPKIWGSKDGFYMFSNRSVSYNKKLDYMISAKEVADKWQEVTNNLKKLEEKRDKKKKPDTWTQQLTNLVWNKNSHKELA